MQKQKKLLEIVDGKVRIHFHQGQYQAWDSSKRFVIVLAGTQGGKTSFGPIWLHREIQRKGPGDYFIVSPSYKLLALKALPEFRTYFEEILKLGTYKATPVERFEFSDTGLMATFGNTSGKCTVFFGHADNPDSLESATAKAAWLDEAGQKRFKASSYEAIRRRLALHGGRLLITTTPYYLGWIKTEFYDPWKARKDIGEDHPEIDVINFPSTMNPSFPATEMAEAKERLASWRYEMFYLGKFSRPGLLIYDIFDAYDDVVDPFVIPTEWRRVWGVDFGLTNTAVAKFALERKYAGNGQWGEETGVKYLYGEYYPGQNLEPKQHVQMLRRHEKGPQSNITAVGGSHTEKGWRVAFTQSGLAVVEPPDVSVEVRIENVYAQHAQGKIKVFKTCKQYLKEKDNYEYEVDDNGEPTQSIKDKKKFHMMDAEGYAMLLIEPPRVSVGQSTRRNGGGYK